MKTSGIVLRRRPANELTNELTSMKTTSLAEIIKGENEVPAHVCRIRERDHEHGRRGEVSSVP